MTGFALQGINVQLCSCVVMVVVSGDTRAFCLILEPAVAAETVNKVSAFSGSVQLCEDKGGLKM